MSGEGGVGGGGGGGGSIQCSLCCFHCCLLGQLTFGRMWVIGPTARASCLAIWRSCDFVAADSLPLMTLSMLGHAVAGVFIYPAVVSLPDYI